MTQCVISWAILNSWERIGIGATISVVSNSSKLEERLYNIDEGPVSYCGQHLSPIKMLGTGVPWWTCRHRRTDLYLVWWQVASMWRCQLSWLTWCMHWRWSSLNARLSWTWTACIIANSWWQHSWHSCDCHHQLIIWCAHWRCRLYLWPPAGPRQPLSQTSGWPTLSTHTGISEGSFSARLSCRCGKSSLLTAPATTTNTFTNQLIDVITSELEKVAPLKCSSRRASKSITRWLSTDAVQAKQERRHLEKRWMSSGCKRDRIAYRLACRKATTVINESRRTQFNQRLSNCTNSGQQWRIAKELLHTGDRDVSRTDEENQSLCLTFSDFFTTKIRLLQD